MSAPVPAFVSRAEVKWGYLVDDFLIVNFRADRHEIAKELIDNLAWPEVWQLEQLGMSLDDLLDQPLDILACRIGQLVPENVGLFNDGEGIVRSAWTGIHLGGLGATQPQPRT